MIVLYHLYISIFLLRYLFQFRVRKENTPMMREITKADEDNDEEEKKEEDDKTKEDNECHKNTVIWKCNRSGCEATGVSTSVYILPSRHIETVSRLDANGNAIIGTNHRWERS